MFRFTWSDYWKWFFLIYFSLCSIVHGTCSSLCFSDI
jgi:hypothetical protein